MEDTEIIELYWKRCEKAIMESNAKYGSYCFAVANNILDSKEDSDECVNDTWLHTWNAIPPKRPNMLKLFFAKIIRNISIDRIKVKMSLKRGSGEFTSALDELEECISEKNGVEDILDEKMLEECIEAFLMEVSVRERNFFLRRYFFTEAVSQIAKRYNESENTVSVTLHRTRARLKKYLEREYFKI